LADGELNEPSIIQRLFKVLERMINLRCIYEAISSLTKFESLKVNACNYLKVKISREYADQFAKATENMVNLRELNLVEL